MRSGTSNSQIKRGEFDEKAFEEKAVQKSKNRRKKDSRNLRSYLPDLRAALI